MRWSVNSALSDSSSGHSGRMAHRHRQGHPSPTPLHKGEGWGGANRSAQPIAIRLALPAGCRRVDRGGNLFHEPVQAIGVRVAGDLLARCGLGEQERAGQAAMALLTARTRSVSPSTSAPAKGPAAAQSFDQETRRPTVCARSSAKPADRRRHRSRRCCRSRALRRAGGIGPLSAPGREDAAARMEGIEIAFADRAGQFQIQAKGRAAAGVAAASASARAPLPSSHLAKSRKDRIRVHRAVLRRNRCGRNQAAR